MKLPADAVIAREKVTHYLLVRRSRGDKSAFLWKGGYSVLDPDALLSGLAAIRETGEARLIDENKFGRYSEVIGVLHGPSGIDLKIKTIWMTEHLSGITKFITLIPLEA